jgi:hypothetical protein
MKNNNNHINRGTELTPSDAKEIAKEASSIWFT